MNVFAIVAWSPADDRECCDPWSRNICREDPMTALLPRKSFGSDNHAGTHPAVMRAIADANVGDAVAYGADPWTAHAVSELRDLTGAQGDVYLVLNGSGANVLGLGLLL